MTTIALRSRKQEQEALKKAEKAASSRKPEQDKEQEQKALGKRFVAGSRQPDEHDGPHRRAVQETGLKMLAGRAAPLDA